MNKLIFSALLIFFSFSLQAMNQEKKSQEMMNQKKRQQEIMQAMIRSAFSFAFEIAEEVQPKKPVVIVSSNQEITQKMIREAFGFLYEKKE